MSSKTKIVVLRMKEIIYTAIFIGLGLLLITLFLIMFRPKREAAPTASDAVSAAYIPGVYSAALPLGSQNVNVEVTVDENRITSVACTPLSSAVETMYPLIAPAAESLAAQIVNTQSFENLSYAEGSAYTSQALVNTIKRAAAKAAAPTH